MTATKLTGKSDDVFDPWLTHRHWADNNLTYSFPTDGSFFSYQDTNDVTPLTAGQQDAVRRAFSDIAGFTGLTFTEITETASTEATLRFGLEKGLDGAYAYLPAGGERAGDSFYGRDADDPRIGNESFVYFTHEIGHAMGLDHGHEFKEFVDSGLDSQEYTVVTYTDFVGDNRTFSFDSGVVDWAQSYMQLDIAAMQFLYGANHASSGEIWSGDTVYGFNPSTGEMSVNGLGVGAPVGNRIFRTIWDGDGTDTYNLGNYQSDLKIDLHAGGWSTFARKQLADLNGNGTGPKQLAEGNVANARLVEGDLRALIENAIGGSGDDEIRGNRVANDLLGGAGADRLFGRKGEDTLFGNDGKDLLKGGADSDFLLGGNGRDVLRGGNDDDHLAGGKGHDKLVGGADDDILRGRDGNDTLIGGAGFDRLFGDGGNDEFLYRNIADSVLGAKSDWIMDFEPGTDVINLSALSTVPMTLVLDGPTSGGSASVSVTTIGSHTHVRAETDGDGMADFRVIVVDVTGLSADDFLL